MIVITDTTPLRYLAVLGELEILPRLFGEVLCPVEVLGECCDEAAPETLRVWATNPPVWLKVIEAGQVDERLADLDRGEAAAITFALGCGADLLLIDERKGRARAAALGLKRTGTLGVLAQAGRRGWVDYRAAAGRLIRETNFRASPAVIEVTWSHSGGGASGE